MGKFEDEIKKKLEEGSIDYSPSDWNQMHQKLSEKSSYSEFEKKMKDTLSSGTIPLTEGSWDSFNERINLLNEFEKTLSDKLNSGKENLNPAHWEDFSEKLSTNNLTTFEKAVKTSINSGSVAYNHDHWKALKKKLKRNQTQKILWRSAAALLLLITTGIGINMFSNDEQKTQREFSQSNKTETFKNEFSPTKENIILNDNQLNINSISPISDISRDENHSVNTVNSSFGNDLPSFDSTTENNLKQKNIEKLTSLPSFSVVSKNPMNLAFEMLRHQHTKKENSKVIYTIHPGATLWLNFWDNPSLTGLYGKNNLSGFYFNDWEFSDENRDLSGELNFVQPLVRIGAYERRLNNDWAIGGYFNYQLKKNWNIREYAATVSYTKQLLEDYNFRFGAGATFRSQNLAVNELTLREKAINSNYIFTTEMGSIKSREEYQSAYHLGGFINHKNFFLGYTIFNFGFNHLTNDNDVTLTRHNLIGGIHSPEIKKFKASGLMKFEKELFTNYSPAVGLTYNDRIFAMYEYENLSGNRLSIGYQMSNGFKAQFNYNINNIENYKVHELNLDNFTERKGYVSAGINYIF